MSQTPWRRLPCLAALGLAGWLAQHGAVPARAQGVESYDSAVAQCEEISASRVLRIVPDQSEPPVITALALSPDGTRLAAAGDDHVVRLWNLSDGSLLFEKRHHNDWVRAVAFDPSGGLLVSAGDDHRVHFCDPSTGQAVSTLADRELAVYCLAFTPDGGTLAVAGHDDKVWLYDVHSAGPPRQLEAPGRDVRALAISPDGHTLAAGGHNGLVRVWDLDHETTRFDVAADRTRVRALCFSPDGAQLAAGGDGRLIHVVDPREGTEINVLRGPPAKTLALVYCGERTLVSGASDNLIRVWDVAGRREIARLVGHTGSVTSLAFHARTGLLASGSFDTSVRLWDLTGERGQIVRQAKKQ